MQTNATKYNLQKRLRKPQQASQQSAYWKSKKTVNINIFILRTIMGISNLNENVQTVSIELAQRARSGKPAL